MKIAIAMVVSCLVSSSAASAVQNASDNAGDVAYDDGWQNGDDGGTGFGGGWELVDYTGNPGSAAGQDLASSTGNGGGENVDTGGRSFRLTASGNGESVATRPLANALAVGEAIGFDLDVAPLAGGLGSVILAGAGPARLVIGATDTSYYVTDSTGSHSLGIPIDGEAIGVRVTLTGADSYSLGATPAVGSPVSRSGTMTSSGPIDHVTFDVYAPDATERTLFFNRITVPEADGWLAATLPITILGLLGARGGVRARRPEGSSPPAGCRAMPAR